MRGSRLIFAAVMGIAVAASGAARAESFFDALGDLLSPDDSSQYDNRVLYPGDVPRQRVVPFRYHRQEVDYQTNQPAGTVVIDPDEHFLYFVLGGGEAIRYGIGVGRTGFGWRGTVRVGNKAEWPVWTPPPVMIARERQRGHKLPPMMAGGPQNPLGARAMYLYGNGGDTGFRIHGTSEPWTIGLNVSSGCIRLINDDVIDLYDHVKVGAKVVVL
jgi:lipoprotein-anchoring transpeptidase ErfK/SrfK